MLRGGEAKVALRVVEVKCRSVESYQDAPKQQTPNGSAPQSHFFLRFPIQARARPMHILFCTEEEVTSATVYGRYVPLSEQPSDAAQTSGKRGSPNFIIPTVDHSHLIDRTKTIYTTASKQPQEPPTLRYTSKKQGDKKEERNCRESNPESSASCPVLHIPEPLYPIGRPVSKSGRDLE